MTRTINSVALFGNVVADPEFSVVQSAVVAHFTLATHRGEGDGKETEFHRVTVWGRPADVLRRVKKGDQLYVSGRLEYGKRTDGAQTVDVIAREVVLGQRAER